MVSGSYIVEKIDFARTVYGITIAELARRVGMTPNALGQSLRGRRTLTASELVELAIALGLGIDAFVDPERGKRASECRQRLVNEFGTLSGAVGFDTLGRKATPTAQR